MLLEIIKERKNSQEAIKSGDIRELTGLSKVKIRAEINKLRCDGEPICSCSNGYYYSDSYEDIMRTITGLNSRIRHMTEAIDGLSRRLGGEEYE